jgi:beta-glucosidase-like glycosyl hydrolase
MTNRAQMSIAAGCDLVLCCTGRIADNEAAIVGISEALKGMRSSEVKESANRIERVLAPYRITPGSINRLLKDQGYQKRRQQIEAIAEEIFTQDPTA